MALFIIKFLEKVVKDIFERGIDVKNYIMMNKKNNTNVLAVLVNRCINLIIKANVLNVLAHYLFMIN